jgi:nucleotide-binding universal stress UspA family protein
MSTPVVVGVDGSESALDAVRWAADEARRRHTSLRVVHAYEIPVGYPPGFVDWHALHQAFAAQGRSWLDQARQAAEQTAPGLVTEVVEVKAGAVPALVKESAQAALVVLGERLASCQEKYPDVPVSRYVSRERASRALLRYAESAQLVVVGSRGRVASAGCCWARPASTCSTTHHARSRWSAPHRRLTASSVDCRAGYAETVCRRGLRPVYESGLRCQTALVGRERTGRR